MIMSAIKGMYGLGLLEHWNHGFRSHSRYACMSALFCVVLSCEIETFWWAHMS